MVVRAPARPGGRQQRAVAAQAASGAVGGRQRLGAAAETAARAPRTVRRQLHWRRAGGHGQRGDITQRSGTAGGVRCGHPGTDDIPSLAEPLSLIGGFRVQAHHSPVTGSQDNRERSSNHPYRNEVYFEQPPFGSSALTHCQQRVTSRVQLSFTVRCSLTIRVSQ